ncbi:phospholipase [Kaistia sp. 32K]|uniref:alpha/beta hydrolase n=1 Tax=Kaistia sp. 32K TaxID=2795690 RepID=UPI001914E852|nr:alpha/beta hydrolase [Kaistia sp. 32K]BCP54567.1 phospholipase [Kaistia sp. 32K]
MWAKSSGAANGHPAIRRLRRIAMALLLPGVLLAGTASAQVSQLAPYKDDLFGYGTVLESRDGGAFRVVDYDEMRDINGRDEVPERKVQGKYVSLKTKRVEDHLTYRVGDRALKYVGAGATKGRASMIVIYLHGQNGTRFQGADDWTFGGNFNRVKNLTVAAGGAYLSPDFSDFEANGTAEIKALMQDYAARSPGAPIFVACGSYGGKLCWSLARDPEAASMISGLILLGSLNDPGFLKTAAMKKGGRQIPIFIGHGSHDPIIDWKTQQAFFDQVRKKSPGYPIKFVLFQNGNHGTPIRMTDWRETLNWMLASGGK